MADTVPIPPLDHLHPAWCDANLCTFARGASGSHRSSDRTVVLTTGTVTAYLDLGRPPAVPLVVVEHRGCGCLECEPLAVLTFRAEAATEAVAKLAELAREMVKD